MRSDYANLILGLRVNTWVSGLLFVAAVIAFLLTFRRPRSQARSEEAAAPAVE
jgi:hypothetical protein